MAREAYLKRMVNSQNAVIDYTPTSAETEGQVVKINDGTGKAIAGVTLADIAANVKGQIDVDNIYAVTCAAAQTFSVGDQVYWDHENSRAIPSTSANATNDFFIGSCMEAKSSTSATFVRIRLNWGPSAFSRGTSSSSSSSSSSSA